MMNVFEIVYYELRKERMTLKMANLYVDLYRFMDDGGKGFRDVELNATDFGIAMGWEDKSFISIREKLIKSGYLNVRMAKDNRKYYTLMFDKPTTEIA